MRLFRYVLFVLLGVNQAQVVDVLTKVKTFRDSGLALLDGLAEELKSKNEEALSEKTKKFREDWLSVLGVHKGLTGLAKDFTMNYFGREAYHSVNGPLVDAIKGASAALGRNPDAAAFQQALKKVCFEGKRIFQAGGSLHEMLSDLLELLDDKQVKKALPAALRGSQLIDALNYFAGPREEAHQEEL
ncbi:unnamed protein product [Durusdinium trenchii]|uniref:Secreted protein n=2 Tax=Durusdinium trenchii TaxID=1381693 RepID=A0ABP0RT00_9DINO